ncbi:hypothetical protein D3C81_1615740 [compost metagenome]
MCSTIPGCLDPGAAANNDRGGTVHCRQSRLHRCRERSGRGSISISASPVRLWPRPYRTRGYPATGTTQSSGGHNPSHGYERQLWDCRLFPKCTPEWRYHRGGWLQLYRTPAGLPSGPPGRSIRCQALLRYRRQRDGNRVQADPR